MDLLNKGVAEGNFDVQEKKQRVVYEKSYKVPNFATITVMEEDHTLGNIVRQQILTDRRTRFAGYRKPHPLFDLVEIKVQSNEEAEPFQLVNDACRSLIQHVEAMETSFENALMNYSKQKDLQNQLDSQLNLGGY